MRNIICALALSLALSPCLADDSGSAVAAPSATDTVVTTLLSDGSTNTWSQADLVAALQLMNRKYHRDMQTAAGRQAWHGKRLSKIADVEAMESIETYEDGTVFRFPAELPKVRAPKQPSLNTNGIPVRLAKARARRQAEKATTNIVTVVVTPDYTWDFNNPETMEKLDNLSREEVDALPPDVRRAYFYFDAERKATTNTVTVVATPDK